MSPSGDQYTFADAGAPRPGQTNTLPSHAMVSVLSAIDCACGVHVVPFELVSVTVFVPSYCTQHSEPPSKTLLNASAPRVLVADV